MSTYLMRVQAIDSDKVHVVEAKGKISTIVKTLGLVNMHVVNYTEIDNDAEPILLVPSSK